MRIGDRVSVLGGFISLGLAKRTVNPHKIGEIRCGRFIGTYDALLSREWEGEGYSKEEVELVKVFAAFCRENEHLMVGRGD